MTIDCTNDHQPGKGKLKENQELRDMTVAKLKDQLEDYKKELADLQVARTQSSKDNSQNKVHKIHVTRKKIARVLTVLNHKARSEVRTALAKKKYQPLDLRPKKTRAIRRRLTTTEKDMLAPVNPKQAKERKRRIPRMTAKAAQKYYTSKPASFAVKAEN
jgi:large subunit ribosomal protein L35e